MTDPTTAAMDLARSALREQADRIEELEEALQLVKFDKSFCCLKERTQETVRSVLNKEKK